jgi:hypothetical protein
VIIEVVLALASIAMLMVAIVLAPLTASSSGQCPPGMDLRMGVRRSGAYECWTIPPQGCGEAVGPSRPCPEPRITKGQIHCTNGTQPIVRDFRTVGCQR